MKRKSLCISFLLSFYAITCLAASSDNNKIDIPRAVSTDPVVTIKGATTVCQGKNITLTALVESGTAPFTFNWAGPNFFTAMTESISVYASPASAGTYTVTVADMHGNATKVAKTITVNATQIPTIKESIQCFTVTVNGIATPQSTVTLFEDAVKIGVTKANKNGSFTFTLPVVSNGTHIFTAQETTVQNCVGSFSDPLKVVINCFVTITLPKDSVVHTPKPTITGTATPHSIISILANDILIGKAQVDAHGNFSFVPVEPLSDGKYTIVATLLPQYGPLQKSNTVILRVESQAKCNFLKALIPKLCK